jgi:hypothetical protein
MSLPPWSTKRGLRGSKCSSSTGSGAGCAVVTLDVDRATKLTVADPVPTQAEGCLGHDNGQWHRVSFQLPTPHGTHHKLREQICLTWPADSRASTSRAPTLSCTSHAGKRRAVAPELAKGPHLTQKHRRSHTVGGGAMGSD